MKLKFNHECKLLYGVWFWIALFLLPLLALIARITDHPVAIGLFLSFWFTCLSVPWLPVKRKGESK